MTKRRPTATITPATASKSLAEIKAIIAENRAAGRDNHYAGLTSSEIGQHSGAMMFGEDGEGYPGDAEWSLRVD